MRVRYTPRARGDIEGIWRYIEERSPSGAGNVLKAIYAGVQFIAEYPEASERTDDPSVRVKVVRRYRYRIFYRIIDDRIEILHVRHTSRRPWIDDR
jgi:plasmid stabilization system protein ParE